MSYVLETIEEKFKSLATGNAPGQEVRQNSDNLISLMRGSKLVGTPIDFSHGDVNAFPPTPGAQQVWNQGFEKGAEQAYTEYRGDLKIRTALARKLGHFTGKEIVADNELIITPGTQGALFLALGAVVTSGTKIAVVEPDYFANRKLVSFFGGEIVPIALTYQKTANRNGIDLDQLEAAFMNGTEVLVFSTPNNPTGLVYSKETIQAIAKLAHTYQVTVIVDQLYSRMLYSGESYTHLRSLPIPPKNLITIMGPSKTESLSGFRLGVAFGTSKIIDRMESLQAIVSLRASGYNQTVLNTWFLEPDGWLAKRIIAHEAIRDELVRLFTVANIPTATPQAGSYLFPQLPKLSTDLNTFIRLLRYQAGVTVTPGPEFGPGFEHSIRLNFSQDHLLAVAATKRIIKMVEIYKL